MSGAQIAVIYVIGIELRRPSFTGPSARHDPRKLPLFALSPPLSSHPPPASLPRAAAWGPRPVDFPFTDARQHMGCPSASTKMRRPG